MCTYIELYKSMYMSMDVYVGVYAYAVVYVYERFLFMYMYLFRHMYLFQKCMYLYNTCTSTHGFVYICIHT